MCLYCSLGWPKPVADIFDKYEAIIGASSLEYGPGHIVWADCNFEDDHIEFCLEECDKSTPEDRWWDDIEEIRGSLAELLAVPEEVRCPFDSDDTEDGGALRPEMAGLELVKGR